MDIQHIVNTSGGEASWFTAECVAEEHGTARLRLLFADVFIEDADLYRFLIESSAHVFGIKRPRKIQQLCTKALNIPPLKEIQLRKWALRELARETMKVIPGLVWIAEGRTPWEVFRDVRFLGNSRVDPCSKILKRDFLWRYIETNFNKSNAVIYFGLDANEEHRLMSVWARVNAEWVFLNILSYTLLTESLLFFAPRERPLWKVSSPLIDRFIFKEQIRGEAEKRGIRLSESYALGMSHDNCSGLCVKAGHASWKTTLLKRPEAYAYAESEEQSVMALIERDDVGVLRDRTGGSTTPITLSAFRERVEQGAQVDLYDLGGCGCAV